jgi:hypothetical protein
MEILLLSLLLGSFELGGTAKVNRQELLTLVQIKRETIRMLATVSFLPSLAAKEPS